jgi:hypothetical protein
MMESASPSIDLWQAYGKLFDVLRSQWRLLWHENPSSMHSTVESLYRPEIFQEPRDCRPVSLIPVWLQGDGKCC